MKREIKFRAWCQLFNEMIYDYCVVDDCLFNGYDLTNNQHEIIDVMQYTGLKDCKGKEIYEGDILNIDKSKHPQDKDNLKEVYFDYGMFRTNDSRGFSFNLVDTIKHLHYKIVGNIYENSNLLKN